jgi:hypothetical protein
VKWAGAVLLLSLASNGLPASPSPDRPKISVEPQSFDFGEALPGRTLEKDFVVKNFGSEDLKITDIVPTCGCTVVDKSYPRVLKAGASGSFRLRLTTPNSVGHVVKSVLVKSNDPAKPSLELKLEARIVPESR